VVAMITRKNEVIPPTRFHRAAGRRICLSAGPEASARLFDQVFSQALEAARK